MTTWKNKITSLFRFTLLLLVANLANTKLCKNTEKMTEILAHGYSSESESERAIQWIPTWQVLDGFQTSLRPCVLNESLSGHSTGRFNATFCYCKCWWTSGSARETSDSAPYLPIWRLCVRAIAQPNNLVMCVFKKCLFCALHSLLWRSNYFYCCLRVSLRKYLTWSTLFYRYFSNSIATDTYFSLEMVKECSLNTIYSTSVWFTVTTMSESVRYTRGMGKKQQWIPL